MIESILKLICHFILEDLLTFLVEWVFLLPGKLILLMRRRDRGSENRTHEFLIAGFVWILLFGGLWAYFETR